MEQQGRGVAVQPANTYFVNLSSTAGGTVTLTVQWMKYIYVNYNYGGTAGVTNPTAWTYDVAQYASAPTRILLFMVGMQQVQI